jgi:hypothetical protein
MIVIAQLRRLVAFGLAAMMFLTAGPIDAARAALVTPWQVIKRSAQVDARGKGEGGPRAKSERA